MQRLFRSLLTVKPTTSVRFGGSVEVPVYQRSDYVRTVLKGSGLGRHVGQLARITLYFDKTRTDSIGVREWLCSDLTDFARANPGTVVYVLPKRNKSPYYIAEYLNGRQVGINLTHFSRSQVAGWVDYARTRSGLPIVKFEHDWRTETPSVQGLWSPFQAVPTKPQAFPLEESPPTNVQPSATDVVLKLVAEQGLENVVLES